MKYLQDPPYSIQIELTEGCNRSCYFCGIQGIRDNKANGPNKKNGTASKPYKFLSIENATTLAKQISSAGWSSRIVFSMHGEPTLNPNYNEIIKVFRKNLLKSSFLMISNGHGFIKNSTDSINAVMKSGINILHLDNYEYLNTIKIIIEKYKGPYDILFYPQNKKANPQQRKRPNEHMIVICEDIAKGTGGINSVITNHAGCSFPKSDLMEGKRCAKPFRELSVRWDGNIAICCQDFRGIYKCGNINNQSIDHIWNNKYFRSARKALYHGMRTFDPCRGCDARSYRIGLLPDKYGKESLPEPNNKTWKFIKKANSGKPYTKPVKRPWE